MTYKLAVIFVLCWVSLNAFPAQNQVCENIDELVSDPKNCNRFYQCTTYGWANMPCYPTLYFNPDTNKCDYPENVKCDCPPQSVALSNLPTCTEEQFDQLYPDPADCGRFLECSPLGLVSMPCAANLYYNDAIKQCDYPENVSCDNDSGKNNCTTS